MRSNRDSQRATRWARGLGRLLIGSVVTVAALPVTALAAVTLSRLQPVKDRWLRLDRFENPVVRPIAGRRVIGRLYFGFQLGVLKHVGRKSGRTYETPLGAYRLGDGFVFALFYGSGVDWACNVLAAGGGRLRWMGREYGLERPEIVSAADVLGNLPTWPRLILMAAGTKQFLWLHRQREGSVTATAGASPVEAPRPHTA